MSGTEMKQEMKWTPESAELEYQRRVKYIDANSALTARNEALVQALGELLEAVDYQAAKYGFIEKAHEASAVLKARKLLASEV